MILLYIILIYFYILLGAKTTLLNKPKNNILNKVKKMYKGTFVEV